MSLEKAFRSAQGESCGQSPVMAEHYHHYYDRQHGWQRHRLTGRAVALPNGVERMADDCSRAFRFFEELECRQTTSGFAATCYSGHPVQRGLELSTRCDRWVRARRIFMRTLIVSLIFATSVSLAYAQQTTPPASAVPNKDSPHSTGRTVVPDKQGENQPQGPTGPINTESGGAPASSPQGETPPGMQSAPQGSSKTIVDGPAKK